MSIFRVVHASDIHFTLRPRFPQLFGKRIVGTLNLYLLGRHRVFSESAQKHLVRDVQSAKADLFVITGDLTSLSTPGEFELARRTLQPALESQPSFVIPGNHDQYTHDAVDGRYFQNHFHDVLGEDSNATVTRILVGPDDGGVAVLGLNPCRPTGLHARGLVPGEQLDALSAELARADVRNRFLYLSLHYPIMNRHGTIYDHPRHGLQNVGALIDVLKASRRKPDAILHGHIHRGFQTHIDLDGVVVPIFDPGSGGLRKTSTRAAHFNIYQTQGRTLQKVEIYRHNGEKFELTAART